MSSRKRSGKKPGEQTEFIAWKISGGKRSSIYNVLLYFNVFTQCIVI